MPVEFLTDEQKSRYGRYNGSPDRDQLDGFFHLDDFDKSLVEKCRRDYNKLGYAIQLCTLRFLGTFLPNPILVPENVVNYLAQQLGVSKIHKLPNYMDRKQTRHLHATEIRKTLGYNEFNEQPFHFRLVRWLFYRAWISNEPPSLMFDLATSWLIRHKILLPGVSTLTRLISQVRCGGLITSEAGPDNIAHFRPDNIIHRPTLS
jgi:hypothetical protein